jgi:hypothetical protein
MHATPVVCQGAAQLRSYRSQARRTSGPVYRGAHVDPGDCARIIRNELYVGIYTYNRTNQPLKTARKAVDEAQWVRTRITSPIIGARTFATAQRIAGVGHRSHYSDKQLLDALRALLSREGYLSWVS